MGKKSKAKVGGKKESDGGGRKIEEAYSTSWRAPLSEEIARLFSLSRLISARGYPLERVLLSKLG